MISLSNQVKHTMNAFAEDTRDELIEHSIIMNDKGQVIYESDGDSDSVDVHIEKITEYLNKECSDLLDDFHKEVDALDDDGSFYSNQNKIYEKYEKLILDRINERGLRFNLDHNHPAPYGTVGEDVPLDSPVFTTLSGDDMNIFIDNNIAFRIGYDSKKPRRMNYFHFDNLIKSMTCECSNGTRMTLVNKNSVGKDNDISITKFWEAEEHLLNNWYKYKDDIIKEGEDYQSTLINKYKDYTGDDLKTRLQEDTDNYIRRESKKVIPNRIKKDIKEFEDLGVELRVDWL